MLKVFFKKWNILYYTTEMDQFFRIKNLLYEQGVPFKEETINNQQRNLFYITGRPYGRTGYVKNMYRILVLEQDEGRARKALSGARISF